MKITDMKHGDVQAATQYLFAEIAKQNGDNASDVINRMKSNGAYLTEVVAKMSKSGYQPNKAHVRARKIMGSNMFGIDDAIERFGVYPLKSQLDKLSEIRTSKGRLIDEEELKRFKNTHILIAVFPVYPLKAVGTFITPIFINEMSFRLFHDTNFHINEDEVGWYLIRKSAFQESYNKEWVHQIQTLPPGEIIPKQYMVGYMIAGHFLKTDERLFVDRLVRCANNDLQSKGTKTVIGFDRLNGLILTEKNDEISSPYLGLASMISQE